MKCRASRLLLRARRAGRSTGLVSLGICLVAALSGCWGQAGSAEQVSASFWGVVPQSRTTLAQFRRLRDGGVGAVRIVVRWRRVMPRPEAPPRWGELDEVVAKATRAKLSILPFVYGSPRWIAKDERTLPVTNARQRNGWIEFLRALALRYGPRGSFWAAHPRLPRRPIRIWQIWNEPNLFFFARRPDPRRYAELVEISHRALSGVDPGAQLILGGMFALPGQKPPLAYPADRFLSLMYKRDPQIKRYISGIAIHPYTRNFRSLVPIFEQVHRTMRRAGDPGVGLWITELGWGSQRGPGATEFEKGRAGQARQLKGAFRLLLKNRERWRVRHVYWFAVADSHAPHACNFCDSAGLFTARFRPKPAWMAFERIAGGGTG